ncbi:alpha/beta hydrolase [Streptacidiphilus sp. ASG 303]|uniref:alpha/beta fold hydrolase n=1 Tax=Streptacidiphilus sp. ASG 303 TaxID=2896847 RepID=UPI001E3F148F|nr:alpha/beta hydrolase [Streptacidiphilus sp. ASG 303]MCD0485725.1 alpha/beta hydrolase [Streptacidiphilus sp. ASG 303]
MTDASDVFSFDSGDGPLAYRDTGTGTGGPVVVLLHSGFVDGTTWDDVVPLLARDHRVVVPDARGHGASANASGPFRQTDDLAALLRHLGTRPAVLVGVSMGAMIAVETALEHPELVRALVVSGAGTGAEPEQRDPWGEDLRNEQFRALAEGDVAGWIDGFVRWAAGPHRAVGEVDPDVLRRIRESAVRTLSKHTPDEPNHTVAVDGTATRVKGIAVPVLAVHGGLDVPDYIRQADDLVHAVADGRAVTFEDAGHYVHMERPDAFARTVAEFVAGLPETG